MFQQKKDVRGSFWAAYLNIATNNVQTILRYASGERQTNELRSQEFLVEEQSGSGKDRNWVINCDAIKTLFSDKKADLTKQRRIMEIISKALPFMSRIKKRIEMGVRKNGKIKTEGRNLTPQEFGNILRGYLNYLFDLRNYFTHAKHAPVSMGDMNPYYLGIIFDANVGTAKERFYSEDKIKNDDTRFNFFRRFKGVKTARDENGQVILDEKGKAAQQAMENPDFKFYLWEMDPANESSKKGHINPWSELTAQGLAFFVCQFLEKKYANMALDSIGISGDEKKLLEQFGFSNHAVEQLTLIKRVFTITCARLPRTRIESDCLMSNQVLGLDILNLLHKCPAPLFELLSFEDQNLFRTESETTGQEVLLRRFEDRFPYLSLNYLDRIGNFPNLRFCIDMGNFYFRCHPRVQIDGSRVEDRRLKKRITCYTKIQDAMEYYQTERKREGTLYHVATPDHPNPPQTYRLDMVPQYRIKDNRIGIALKKFGCNRSLFTQPTLPVNQPKGKDKPQTFAPDAWLPIHELMPILFLATRNKTKEIEDAIYNHIQRWRAFLDELKSADMPKLKAMLWRASKQTRNEYCQGFKEKYGFDIMDLPDEIRYYLLNGKVKAVYLQSQGTDRTRPLTVDKAAEIWLRKEVEFNRALIRRFKSEQNYDFKLGKGKQPRFTSGYIAQWLVRDFMRFQKSNGDETDRFGKLKSSPDYMALQSSLACFDSQKQDIRQLFVRARLIDGTNFDHPFLGNVLKKADSLTSLRNFFTNYLAERLDWLRSIDGDDAYQLRRLYKRNEAKNRIRKGQIPANLHFATLAENLAKEPVCLPRGLFDSLVRQTLQKEYPTQYAAEVPDGQRANFTWLMQKSLQWSGDQLQWFYRLKVCKDASQFKSLFELMGTTNLRYDAAGLRALNEKLEETYDSRREKLGMRMDEDDQMYRRKLNQLRDVWKEIRMISVQDIILRDTIGQLLSLPQNEIRLEDVKPENDLLQQRRERMLNPQRVIDGELTNDSLLNRTVNLKNKVILPNGEGTISLTGRMKRKNFGNFYRMLSDPRLASFLRLYHEFEMESVDYDFLELQEFEAYDRIYRPKIFSLVHDLERTVLEKYPDVYDERKGYANFWAITLKANGGDEFLSILLVMFRNAFAHQYYPEYRCPVKWSAEDKQKFDPRFQQLREKIKADLMKRKINPQGTPALLVNLIYKHAESQFRKAINNVERS